MPIEIHFSNQPKIGFLAVYHESEIGSNENAIGEKTAATQGRGEGKVILHINCDNEHALEGYQDQKPTADILISLITVDVMKFSNLSPRDARDYAEHLFKSVVTDNRLPLVSDMKTLYHKIDEISKDHIVNSRQMGATYGETIWKDDNLRTVVHHLSATDKQYIKVRAQHDALNFVRTDTFNALEQLDPAQHGRTCANEHFEQNADFTNEFNAAVVDAKRQCSAGHTLYLLNKRLAPPNREAFVTAGTDAYMELYEHHYRSKTREIYCEAYIEHYLNSHYLKL